MTEPSSLLRDLVGTSREVGTTSRRLRKIETLADRLGRLPPGDVEIGVAFLTGRLRQGRVGIGAAAIRNARPQGAAASATLTLREVDDTFTAIAGESGSGSGRRRLERLSDLLSRATTDEQAFLIDLLFGELRQGALEGVMVEAVARAATVPAATVRRAVMAETQLGVVAREALTGGAAALTGFGVTLFRPVQPMLARPSDDVDTALEELSDPLLEWKLDGARIQVHKQGSEVRVYSRRLREVTSAVPEVVELARALPAREIILDGEVIALRPDGRPLPFQVTMRRFGRTADVEALRPSLPLSPFIFDILQLDGGSLIDEPLTVRGGVIEGQVPDGSRVPRIVPAGRDEATEFLRDALRIGHEGVMAKSGISAYEAGSRGSAWLKIKPAHTLDLVVLAAEWGHGRRQGYLSNLHLGARDPERGGFVMLGKTFKGLTDHMLAWQTTELLAREIGRDRHTVHVRPELVVEIAFNNVQESPKYPGGVVLRFARVKRYRSDKTADAADTIATVRGLREGR